MRPARGATALVLLGTASLWLLAACGSGSPGNPGTDQSSKGQSASTPAGAGAATSSPDEPRHHPCDFVTKAEAAVILKVPANSGYDASSACIYSPVADSQKQTTVQFATGTRADYDQRKQDRLTSDDIAGIGDAASCEVPSDMPRLTAYSSKANQVVTITGESCDLDKQFALKVFSRL